jgi:hypothetical protein
VGKPLVSMVATSGVSYVRLDPSVLAVSCERIKDALLNELGLSDHWRGAVYLSLHPVEHDQEPILVTSTRHSDGWAYELELPERVDRIRLLRTLVQVLLMEIVNRRARDGAVELPPWLGEGLAAHLQASTLSGLALEPETRLVGQQRNRDSLAGVRERLRAGPPLNLNELNWPTAGQLSGEGLGVYQSCAHLFVHELLRLKYGRECLTEMLLLLPESLNWQTAFLGAFRPHFPRLIDADKWWALTVVHVTGRDPFSIWPRGETWRQLDEILVTPIQVRLQAGELPISIPVKLQNVLAEWDYARQTPLLSQKVNHLQALRLRAAQELTVLIEGYGEALNFYLQKHRSSVQAPSATKKSLSDHAVALSETVKKLDELDARREFLRQQTGATTASAMPP